MDAHNTNKIRGKQVQDGPVSAAQKKAKSLQYTTTYQSQSVDNSPFVAPSTIKERGRIWSEWLQHCDDAETDSFTAWTNFLRNPQSSEGQAPFRAFLRTYVESSVRKTLVTTPEEFVYVRTVDTAFTVQEVWRRLVAAADTQIMSDLRQKFPSEASTWRLRWISKDEGSKESPAYRVVQWIFEELAVELGLSIDPSYRKIEMTSTDIYVLLTTLWSRSRDISCDSNTRINFHAFLLLSAIGGFRRGTVLEVGYNQLRVVVVRDPENISRRRIVVSITIKRNKIKKAAMTSRLRNGGYIGFSITLVPNRIFCLASLILTRAIQQNAFKAQFKTVDDIFDQPELESVDFVPIEWSPAALSKKAFSLSSSNANALWLRLLLVAGFREPARLYSLRVGAGLRMDGVLSSALRNYVMSHTTGVFEAAYQSHNVRANLMSLAFGKGADQDETLFEVLRDTSLSRDPNAPIRISPEEEHKFEYRADIRNLRDAIASSSDRQKKNKLRTSLQSSLETLRKLRLEELRSEYFSTVDHLRATGKSTAGLAPSVQISSAQSPSTADISQLLQPVPNETPQERDLMTRKYIKCLLAFINSESSVVKVGRESIPKSEPNTVENDDSLRSLCLICKAVLGSRSSLTRHYNGSHMQLFDNKFQCPDCHSRGINVVVGSREEWSNHVENTHGRHCAPNWIEKGRLKTYTCPFCSSSFTTITALVGHLNRQEAKGQSWPVECAECIRAKGAATQIDSLWAFLDHLQSVHLPSVCFCGLCGYICCSPSGLTRHCTLQHQKDFEKTFLCPACTDAGLEIEVTVGFSSWKIHISRFHSTWITTSGLLASPMPDESDLRKPPLEYLSDDHNSNRDICTRKRDRDEPNIEDVTNIVEVLSTQELQRDLLCCQSDSGIRNDPDTDNNSLDDKQSHPGIIQQVSKSSRPTDSADLGDLIDPALRYVPSAEDIVQTLDGLWYERNDTQMHQTYCEHEEREIYSRSVSAVTSENTDSEEFTVDCILERWGKDQFLLQWLLDGTCSWVSRTDISSQLVLDFEKGYKGYKQGIEVLRNRRRNGKIEYRVHWKGRPSHEDSWVREKDMDPELASELREQACSRPKKRRRRS